MNFKNICVGHVNALKNVWYVAENIWDPAGYTCFTFHSGLSMRFEIDKARFAQLSLHLHEEE